MKNTSPGSRPDCGKASSRVFVIDDDNAIRESLRCVLEVNGFHVATFDSAEHFLAGPAADLSGCILTDVQMPGMDGIELQNELSRRGTLTAVVMMTGRGIATQAVRAMRAGAVDYLEKPITEAVLLDSVRRALEFVSSLTPISALARTAHERIALLTVRERQVLDLVVDGSSNKAVARVLRISPRTVEVHRARLITKMGTKSLPELVRMAVANAPLAA